MPLIRSYFKPLPPQAAFMKSEAKIRGYGGAMGGGKSRTGCEHVFDLSLEHPGLVTLIARQAHTSIIETTKKTMMNQVIPPALIDNQKRSGGEDYVQLFNGSVIHFVGLDDPVRWFSSEIGMVFFDECQEVEEDVALRIITRLRQRCNDCERMPEYDLNGQVKPCPHMPNKAFMTFNPGNPGHWLQRWFILEGAERTKHGFYKPELWMEDAIEPIGDCEFFFAKATDNPHLPPDYIRMLSGQKEWIRRRYLEGLWEFISGECFFNEDALRFYEVMAKEFDTDQIINGTTAGEIQADIAVRTGRRKTPLSKAERCQVKRGNGGLTVWKTPVREREVNGRLLPAHRYVLSVDASSGRAKDWSAIQVIDVDAWEQVAEYQMKMETGKVAEEAYRLGRIYNDALIVCEITGGWGLAVDQVLKNLKYPRLYTRRVLDRLTKGYTDRTGFDQTTRMRLVILECLETVLQEKELKLFSIRCLNEMGSFVYSEKEKAEAQPGCNDDLVMALAMAVYVASSLPRQLKRPKDKPYVPAISTVTGY